MILTHMTIVVKDQNAALEFYTKKLGLEKKADYQNPGQPRWLTAAEGTSYRDGLVAGGYEF